MKKNLRFFLALWAAKSAALFSRLFRLDRPHLPGSVAAGICPDFLARITKPATVIAVTGTNGKTAVCRILVDLLTADGKVPLHNLDTGNLQGGILSAFLNSCTLTGRFRQEVAVLEIDERSTVHIFKCITPDMVVITNLFRGSFKRCVHSEFIAGLLEQAIPSSATLVLNADDLIVSSLSPQNRRITFGIPKQPQDDDTMPGSVCDLVACPRCNTKLRYEFRRYSHIGRAHCPTCSFGSRPADYEMICVDEQRRRVQMMTPQGELVFPLIGTTVTDHYNLLAAATVWLTIGGSPSRITDSLPTMFAHLTESVKRVGKKRVTCLLSKCQNPTACSRSFDLVRQESGSKAVILLIDHKHDAEHSSENISWLYDTEFEFFADRPADYILVVGSRSADVRVRLLLAGVEDSRIRCEQAYADYTDDPAFARVDHTFILYDRFTKEYADALQERLVARLSGRPPKEETP